MLMNSYKQGATKRSVVLVLKFSHLLGKEGITNLEIAYQGHRVMKIYRNESLLEKRETSKGFSILTRLE